MHPRTLYALHNTLGIHILCCLHWASYVCLQSLTSWTIAFWKKCAGRVVVGIDIAVWLLCVSWLMPTYEGWTVPKSTGKPWLSTLETHYSVFKLDNVNGEFLYTNLILIWQILCHEWWILYIKLLCLILNGELQAWWSDCVQVHNGWVCAGVDQSSAFSELML